MSSSQIGNQSTRSMAAPSLQARNFRGAGFKSARFDAHLRAGRRNFRGMHRTARSNELISTVYQRTIAKLEREPVEDYRIDFEDGLAFPTPISSGLPWGFRATAAEREARATATFCDRPCAVTPAA